MVTAICIATVSRPKGGTLDATIRELIEKNLSNLPVRICVSIGCPVPEGYEDRLPSCVEFMKTTESDWEAWGGEETHRGYHLTWNLLRSHRWLARSGADLCVFAEDDIVLARDWLKRLHALASASKVVDYGISACSSHPLWCFGKPVSTPGGDCIAEFVNPKLFWGNQLLAYPRSTAAAMAAYLQGCVNRWSGDRHDICPEDSRYIGDQATKNFFLSARTPLFVTIPSLAKHVGEYSSWMRGERLSPAHRDHPTARFEEEK